MLYILDAVHTVPNFCYSCPVLKQLIKVVYLGHDIVASFKVKKSISLLEDYLLQLENDIFVEIEGIESKVSAFSIPFWLCTVYTCVWIWTHMLQFSASNSLLKSGGCFISRTLSWNKHNEGCVCGWSGSKIFKNINFSKFDQGIVWIFGYATIISTFDCIFVWGPIHVWGAKISWRNNSKPSTECLPSAESADPFQFYLKLLYRTNTRKFQWADQPAEVGFTSSILWGLTILSPFPASLLKVYIRITFCVLFYFLGGVGGFWNIGN